MSHSKKSAKKTAVNEGSKPDSGPRLLSGGNPQIPKGYGDTRYFHIYENEDLDEDRFASWVKQASNLPGERL